MPGIEIVEAPGQRVLGVRRKGGYRLIPQLLMEVYEYAVNREIPIAGPPVFLCHETSPEAVKEADCRGDADIEVAWPVSRPAA